MLHLSTIVDELIQAQVGLSANPRRPLHMWFVCDENTYYSMTATLIRIQTEHMHGASLAIQWLDYNKPHPFKEQGFVCHWSDGALTWTPLERGGSER